MANRYQDAAAEAYAGGDFAHFVGASDATLARDLPNCGDSLFAFVMRDLSDREECDTLEVALRRMDSAIGALEEVTYALNKLKPARHTDG